MQQSTVSYSMSSSSPGVFFTSVTTAASFKRASCEISQRRLKMTRNYFANIAVCAIKTCLAEWFPEEVMRGYIYGIHGGMERFKDDRPFIIQTLPHTWLPAILRDVVVERACHLHRKIIFLGGKVGVNWNNHTGRTNFDISSVRNLLRLLQWILSLEASTLEML